MSLQWLVDFRGAAGRVIDQGNRPTCLSCATSSAHFEATDEEKSVEFLHYMSRTKTFGVGAFESVRDVLGVDGQPPEGQWPYDPTADDASVTPPASLLGPYANARLEIDADVAHGALVGLLDGGILPIVGLHTTTTFMRLQNEILTVHGSRLSRHAVLLVGAATYNGPDAGGLSDGDVLLCVQNSWGTSWGVGGYGLIGPSVWSSIAIVKAVIVAETSWRDQGVATCLQVGL